MTGRSLLLARWGFVALLLMSSLCVGAAHDGVESASPISLTLERRASHISTAASIETAAARAAACGADKICPEILVHERMKQRAVELPPHEQGDLLRHLGLNDENVDSEDVALYVTRRLREEEVRELREHGVRINRWAYVPPVPNRHPNGYYLANVSYASLGVVREDDRIVRVVSTEYAEQPLNDVGGALLNIPAVHSGAIGPFRGEGVRIAVADSGVDLDHPDFPTPIITYDVTTGNDPREWSTDVANTVTMHGTHVAGTAVGSGGLSGGQYVGAAPEAEFIFYKIGNNFSGNTSATHTIQSILHAIEIEADIYTRSFGSFRAFSDGSSAVCQAYDAAFETGVLSFNSAGNSGADDWHYSTEVAPGTTSEAFTFTMENPFQFTYNLAITFQAVWQDDAGDDNFNIMFGGQNLLPGESVSGGIANTSPRGTKTAEFFLHPQIPPQSKRVYEFALTNLASDGETPRVHVYQTTIGLGTFDEPDPHYTILHPADADTVIAVGAWGHRAEWTNFQGEVHESGFEQDALASFSSRGPRIDGALKPEVIAPGSATISLRDSQFANNEARIISNDGVNDGKSPADYYIAQGTSMAAPLAAGAGALLRQAEPSLTTAQLRTRLMMSAADADVPNPDTGHGLVNAEAAIAAHAADLNHDGMVNHIDLNILLDGWGPCAALPAPCAGDITGDGHVDVDDLLILLNNWMG